MGPSPAVTKTWWKEKPVYQIWPASFCDGNGDGVGDITGIISKLDYIKDLGFEVVWLSPIMKSPQVDMGYDISDYQDIHEAYGTLGDFEALTEACHARGLKLVMDLVVNHTSDQHPWFTESASSLDNPKREWFVWRKGTVDPQTGEKLPPNNWESIFHAWKFDAMTDEWYLHLFCAEQPDLNWENEEVRQAVYEMMRWWLDRGCDGFRVDAIHFISKPGFHDAPHTKDNQYFQPCYKLIAYGPRLKEFLKEMNEQAFSKYDCLSVGEMGGGMFDIDKLAPYCLPEEKMFQMFFQFELSCMDLVPGEKYSVGEWQLSMMKKIIGRWQTGLIERGGWNALYLENHDQARSISRLVSDKPEFRSTSGKLLAMLLTSLCGTVYVYQGQELGQINVSSKWADGIKEFQDVSSINWFNDKVALRRKTEGKEDVETADLIDNLRHRARDNARTPVQWTSEENAGFSTGKPWMKVHSDYKEWNAETLAKDPSSILNFYRTALKTRKENQVLIYGDYTDISAGSEEIYSYIREHEGKRALVVLNFSESTVKDWKIVDGSEWENSNLLVSNLDESATTPVEGGKVTLAPYEGRIYLVT